MNHACLWLWLEILALEATIQIESINVIVLLPSTKIYSSAEIIVFALLDKIA